MVKLKNFVLRSIIKAAKAIQNSLLLASNKNANANANLLSKHLKYTYGDQKGQVDFLINNVFDYENNGLPKCGFFVDLACGDGLWVNNTYFLEKHLGWSGLLFEANPRYKDTIIKNRSSKLVTDCVTDEKGSTVRFRIDNGILGGIVSDETDNSEQIRGSQLKSAEIINISTTSLESELDAVNAPALIDFLSLDIEGAEWIAMRTFPFDRYRFKCMTVERPNKALDMLLEKNGYRQVAHLSFDVVYVHNDFMQGVNFNPNVKFAFTMKKDW
jgi:hypothetical protein